MKKRTGTKRIHNFGSNPAFTALASLRQSVRIEPFIFSDDEKYIIAFSNTRIEIFQISPSDGSVSSIQSLTSQSWLVNTTSAPSLEPSKENVDTTNVVRPVLSNILVGKVL